MQHTLLLAGDTQTRVKMLAIATALSQIAPAPGTHFFFAAFIALAFIAFLAGAGAAAFAAFIAFLAILLWARVLGSGQAGEKYADSTQLPEQTWRRVHMLMHAAHL